MGCAGRRHAPGHRGVPGRRAPGCGAAGGRAAGEPVGGAPASEDPQGRWPGGGHGCGNAPDLPAQPGRAGGVAGSARHLLAAGAGRVRRGRGSADRGGMAQTGQRRSASRSWWTADRACFFGVHRPVRGLQAAGAQHARGADRRDGVRAPGRRQHRGPGSGRQRVPVGADPGLRPARPGGVQLGHQPAVDDRDRPGPGQRGRGAVLRRVADPHAGGAGAPAPGPARARMGSDHRRRRRAGGLARTWTGTPR